MSTITLEERVAQLEQEVLAMKRQLSNPPVVPWWSQISGVFANTPAFDEAVELGRRYRQSQHPTADEDADVSA